jgi:hypothetical protein
MLIPEPPLMSSKIDDPMLPVEVVLVLEAEVVVVSPIDVTIYITYLM